MASSLTLADAKNELEKLIACNEVQYKSAVIGCCKNYFVTFPNDDQKYKYNINKLISNKLRNKIYSYLYIIHDNSLNNNCIIIDDMIAPDDDSDNNRLSRPARRLRRKIQTKVIQNWVKKNSHHFKQEDHTIQIVYDIVTKNNDSGETKTKQHNTKAFDVYGGKVKIRKAIESKNKEIREVFENDYNVELEDLKIKRIYIDDVKMDVKEFKDIKMFGTLLNLCGYDLNVLPYQFINACTVEYHVKMFNKFRDNKWTVERFMKELDMKSIDEGVNLNQLIPLIHQI